MPLCRSVSNILKWVEEHVAPKPPPTPSKPNLDVKDVADVQTVQAFAGPQLWAASLCAPGVSRQNMADSVSSVAFLGCWDRTLSRRCRSMR